MRTTARRALDGAGTLVLVVALLAAPYIDTEVRARVFTWNMNVPAADLAALGAIVVLLARAALTGERPRLTSDHVLEALGWGILWCVGWTSRHAGDALPGAGPDALHTLIRKPIFLCLGWRVAVAGLVAARPLVTRRAVTASALLCAAVLVASSAARIGEGDAFWWRAIAGITNNHKTLAVFLAPLLPLLWGQPLVVGVVGVALVLAWSKAALVAAGMGALWMLSPRRWRPRAVGAAAVLGLGAMAALPWVMQSPEQVDALRSRMSLNKRALEMFLAHPLTGYGAGTNVRYEVSTYPDYRVNGVDAHGVFAKLLSEFGAVGTAGWLLATAALLAVFARRARRARGLDDALLGTFLALHVSLLTSTEAFSQTHWAVLGVLCGLSARPR